MLEDDSAPLAESAGARVLSIYEQGPEDNDAFETWWENQCQRAAEDKLALVVMETTSKKATGWMKKLSRKCRFTNQKNLAKAITAKDGALLMDVDGEPVERLMGWDAGNEESVVEFDVGVQELEEKAASLDDDDATADGKRSGLFSFKSLYNILTLFNSSGEDEEEKMVSTRQTKRSQEANETNEADDEPKPKRRKEDKVEEQDAAPQPGKAAPSRQKRPRQREPEEGKENAVPAAKKVAKAKPAAEEPDTRTEKVIVDEESDNESAPDEDRRLSLPVTEDGWFVAAPAARKNYRKRLEDVQDDEESPKHAAAKTARVKGLIVREYAPPAPRTASRRNNGKKDFKRFRKNHVIRGFSSFSNDGSNNPNMIRLVSVLPKQSERQKELEMKQQELDREQAYADALFNDHAGGGKKGRKSGGGIAGMLSQPKRGRAR
jgi:hypothetical protein